jgi:hypothetical protein
MYAVVCGFNGSTYSRHRTHERAMASAEKVKRGLRRPNCGSLAGYVRVVREPARFTNIVPADNDFGCCQVQQKLWVED